MIQYIYFVKCPNCEDEPFDFFNEAKEFALGCLSNKPIITQIEVNRNDFGECIDSNDLGTVWSWEDMMKETEAEPAVSVFTKDDLVTLDPGYDPEFDELDNSLDDIPDNFRKPVTETLDREIEMQELAKEMFDLGVACDSYEEFASFMRDNDDTPTEELYTIYKNALKSHSNFINRKAIPEGMTIEQLVEEMEENEDEVECVFCQELFPKEDCYYDETHGWLCDDCQDRVVECTWCNELYDRSECRYEVDLGWLCSRCQAAIKSRGETLTFKEGNYWDFLDEKLTEAFNPDETVIFEYDKLDVTLFSSHLDNEVGYYNDEHEVTLYDYAYSVPKGDVATDIWENGFITDEDVTDVAGGLKTLENDAVWDKFLETHFDALLNKYYDRLKEYYRESAKEQAAKETSYEDYSNEHHQDYLADQDDDLDFREQLNDAGSVLEELEEPDAYRSHLSMCPECGITSFDTETGICIECGFN